MKIEKCLIPNEKLQQKTLFYHYDPTQDESYFERYRYVTNQKYKREQLVEVLRNYHHPELVHPAIELNLDRLSSTDSVVVIGGQQAGILTGPLYTIYKVITIIQLAKREEERLQKPVIPVFWIAGEDHDRQEVDHVFMPEGTGMVKHSFPLQDTKKASVSTITIEPHVVHQWLDELHQAIADRPYKTGWVALCEQLTQEPVTWTRFFAKILHYLFAEYGLLLIDSHDTLLRELEADYFHQMIDKNHVLGDAVSRGIQKWEEGGSPSPLQFEDNQAHLFIEENGQRVALYREGNQFTSRNHFFQYKIDDLHEKHNRLSNNVVTRPLMQEMVFPVLAFVGGSSEIDYWGCLKEAFSVFGLQMPIVYPRQNVTIVERSIEKYRENWGVDWETLFAGKGQSLIELWKQTNQPPNVEQQFAELTHRLEELYTPFLQELTQTVGGNMEQMGESTAKKLQNHVSWLKQKAYGVIDTQLEVTLRQQRMVVNAIYPLEGLQERCYNLVYFWNNYGLDWLHMLCKQELPEWNTHQLLFL
ncbi:bacillithiol biosynthesis cysteine-adding enzyme BshC [Shimazuella sp. AN120528]|uniref:bacillithiol biosynthesis cysteine-adding enzyme BshC n=1 Tax=Shimazuella soli TaxID=1892854 RepID=UPI001F0E6542|nr:bacillithiol biosynthesis cysteine-adding enzyme BshC [Shimazuella soli]MCH5584031.1 bacillithiol biosynthesis cysteine-adding enzyme BshC [Shimazuella soli]